MAELGIDERQLFYLEFVNRENHFRHAGRGQELLQFELLRDANPQAVEHGDQAFRDVLQGRLSGDPVRNYQYLFVASTTLCCRCCIEGGLDEERAYNISDLFIQKMDALTDPQQIIGLHREMLSFYLKEMTTVKRRRNCARPVRECLNYIDTYLHEPITLSDLAKYVGMNESYLSVLFKKETGKAVSSYIRERRIRAAEGMLRYTDYDCSEIASFLAFCSQSHFISVFRQQTGLTPRQYRSRYAPERQPIKAQE